MIFEWDETKNRANVRKPNRYHPHHLVEKGRS